MTALELKKQLIRKINRTENNELLEEMVRLIEIEEADLPVYALSDKQKGAIEEAQDQYRKGIILTDEQANKEVDQWLGE